ncbi:LOW QUALITY PROTEIN: hypothetical protein YC2023_019898 [Brassica napus]
MNNNVVAVRAMVRNAKSPCMSHIGLTNCDTSVVRKLLHIPRDNDPTREKWMNLALRKSDLTKIFVFLLLHFQQVHYCPNKKYHTAEDQTPYEAKLTLFSPSIKKTKIILSCPSDRLHPCNAIYYEDQVHYIFGNNVGDVYDEHQRNLYYDMVTNVFYETVISDNSREELNMQNSFIIRCKKTI